MKTLVGFVVCLGLTFLLALGPLRGLFAPTRAANGPTAAAPEDKAYPETLAPACRGEAVEDAAEYYRGHGPHRMVILSESGKQHEWHDRLPEGWRATTIEETVLVLVIGEGWQTNQSTVKAADGQERQVARRHLAVRLVSARTGQVVARASLTRDPADGPGGAQSRPVSWEEQVVPWLRPVQAPPPPFPQALETLRRSVGVPRAARYTRGPGPHRFAVLKEKGGLHPWHARSYVGPEWLASDVLETELVVLVGEQRETILSRHRFTNGPDVVRVQYDLEVRILVAQSGVQLGSRQFRSPVPRAVRVLEPVNLTRLGSSVSAAQVLDWVRDLSEGR